MLYILLPAFNEEKSLGELIPLIAQASTQFKLPYKVCVIDDGSTDGSVRLLQQLSQNHPIHVISHNPNRGYGAALRTGVAWIVEQAEAGDCFITSDSDCSHLPDYYADLLSKLSEGYPVVTASYDLKGGKAIGVPPLRRILSWGANTLLRISLNVPGAITYTNGFRAFRVDALQKAWTQWGPRIIEETGFPGGVELFVKTARASGSRVAEIPFILHYENRLGASKMNIRRTFQAYLKLIRQLS